MKKTALGLRGAVVGALIGCVSLVFSGEFKGNLAEPEFTASYIGYLIPATVLGAIVGFSWRRKQALTIAERPQPAQRSRLFAWAVVSLLLVVGGKVAMDFPNGEGLFHPTHSASVAYAQKVCLERLASDTADSQDAKVTFCSCWGGKMADAAETNPQEKPELVAQRANAACRQQ
jgi:hypothetical protein